MEQPHTLPLGSQTLDDDALLAAQKFSNFDHLTSDMMATLMETIQLGNLVL